jgi:hypothetical protein
VSHRVAVVVWGSMLLVPFFFLAVAAQHRWGHDPREVAGLLFWLTVAASAFNIALSRLLPPRLGPFRAGREATAFTRLVVAWALCEAAALFPLVVWIVSGDPRLLGVCAVDLVALLTLYPSDARWERLTPPEATGSRSLR